MSIVGKAIMLLLRVEAVAVPTQSGTLTYTGEALEPTFSGYSTAQLTIGGDTSATNAGAYVATFTPKDGYEWEDGGTDTRNVPWTINKAALPTPTLSSTSVTLGDNNTSVDVTVFRRGDGVISAISGDTSVATVSVGGSTLTITRVSMSASSTSITMSIAEGTNYLAYTGTLSVAVNVQAHVPALVSIGEITALSVARRYVVGASVGNSALFAGGYAGTSPGLSTVDCYSEALERSTLTSLSVAGDKTGGSVGNYAVFVGNSSADAYDASKTKVSSVPALSVARTRLAAAAIGDYVLFGGGYISASSAASATVDAYDTALTRTTPTGLSTARYYLAGTRTGQYALFGGGNLSENTVSAVVNVYNASLTRQTAPSLSLARGSLAAAHVGDYALFGGGCTYYGSSYLYSESTLDAYDDSLTLTQAEGISSAWALAATQIPTHALFGGGRGRTSQDSWYSNTVTGYSASLTKSSVYLVRGRMDLGAAVAGNYALFAGGYGYSSPYSIANVTYLAAVDAITVESE